MTASDSVAEDPLGHSAEIRRIQTFDTEDKMWIQLLLSMQSK